MPDAKTIWLYREQLPRAGAVEGPFARFDDARRPRLPQAEKGTIKDGGIRAEWKPAWRSQIDRDGCWTLISAALHGEACTAL